VTFESEKRDVEILSRRLGAKLDSIRRDAGLDLEAGRDALSETKLRFLRAGEPIVEPEGWLLTVYRNECIRYSGKRKASGERNLKYLEVRSLERRDVCPSEGLLFRQVSGHMERLRPRDRAILEGRYFEGKSLAELAEQLGVKTESVKTLLARATSRLRRLLVTGS
jgi:RNA polymerase sigma factor (sigma-70 family)